MQSSLGSAVRRLALALLLLAWSTVAQAQEYKGPIWGGSGGTSYNLDCGSTGIMVGLYGKTGQWIDQLGITCQKVNPDGTLGTDYTRGPVGGTGGAGKTVRCPGGSAIRSMFSFTGSFVDFVDAGCCVWSVTSRRIEEAAGMCIGIKLGEIGVLGSATLMLNDNVFCPIDKVAKALRGKYGWYINSLQFVCDDYNK
jgi:hypothetical protein